MKNVYTFETRRIENGYAIMKVKVNMAGGRESMKQTGVFFGEMSATYAENLREVLYQRELQRREIVKRAAARAYRKRMATA